MKKLVCIAIIVLFAIWIRLAFLQIYQGHQYADWSRKISLRHHALLAPRGIIEDRNGRVLADSQPIFEAYVERDQAESVTLESREAWAKLLNTPFEAFEKKWQQNRSLPGYRSILLKSDLEWSQILKLRQLQLDDHLHNTQTWRGLELRYRPIRIYGTADAANDPDDILSLSHLLGYVRRVKDMDLDANPLLIPEDDIGASGVEMAFDATLRGENGREWVWVNAFGRPIHNPDHAEFAPDRTSAVPGDRLSLSIDQRLQKLAYSAFKGKRGALVAIHLPDGHLISAVSVPGYDPNPFVDGISSETWNALLNNPERPLIHRAIQGIYAPGSTYKIVTAAAGLSAGVVTESDTISCPGYFMFGGHRFGCWNKRGHGTVNLLKALEASCDVFFYKLGLKLEVDQLGEMAKRFGLATQSGLHLPFETAGFIPTRLGLETRYKQKWSKGYIFPVVIGQGSNAITPLQSALMIARFATNNRTLMPRLSLNDHALQENTPLLSKENHDLIKEGLRRVIYGASGTAQRLKVLPVTLAGKTGTAQTGSNEEDHAWFVAFAPLDHPRIAIAVLVENGGHGSSVAAPIASDFLKTYFEYYPDDKVEN